MSPKKLIQDTVIKEDIPSNKYFLILTDPLDNTGKKKIQEGDNSENIRKGSNIQEIVSIEVEANLYSNIVIYPFRIYPNKVPKAVNIDPNDPAFINPKTRKGIKTEFEDFVSDRMIFELKDINNASIRISDALLPLSVILVGRSEFKKRQTIPNLFHNEKPIYESHFVLYCFTTDILRLFDERLNKVKDSLQKELDEKILHLKEDHKNEIERIKNAFDKEKKALEAENKKLWDSYNIKTDELVRVKLDYVQQKDRIVNDVVTTIESNKNPK